MTTPSDIQFFRRQVTKWGKLNYARFPWRKTKNRWLGLVAEILLQRTRAEQVVPVYLEFASKYPTPSEFSKDLNSDVFGRLGLRWREKLLHALAELVQSGELPGDKVQLLRLPAVGSYVASAFRSLHLGKRDTIVDSNIVRLYGRFFGLKTNSETRRDRKFLELASKITPEKGFKDFNYALLDFTRAICRPKPQCSVCLISNRCHFANRNKLT